MINAKKLHSELLSANIQIGGCNANGIVWDVDGKTEIQTRPDVAAVIAAHDPAPIAETQIQFTLPIVAPDFIVASPQVKDNPLEALAEAVAEAKKPHGEHKSVALIALSLAHYLENLEKRAKGKL